VVQLVTVDGICVCGDRWTAVAFRHVQTMTETVSRLYCVGADIWRLHECQLTETELGAVTVAWRCACVCVLSVLVVSVCVHLPESPGVGLPPCQGGSQHQWEGTACWIPRLLCGPLGALHNRGLSHDTPEVTHSLGCPECCVRCVRGLLRLPKPLYAPCLGIAWGCRNPHFALLGVGWGLPHPLVFEASGGQCWGTTESSATKSLQHGDVHGSMWESCWTGAWGQIRCGRWQGTPHPVLPLADIQL
jgi:hypothetical protein